MKNLFAILISTIIIGGFITAAAPASATFADPAIFFAPHQDDETLSMGASIISHVQGGRRVIVVLMTDGVNTGVGRTVYQSSWGNNTAKIAERDREFIAAVEQMGAEPVIWAPNGVRPHDGGPNVGAAYGTRGNLTRAKVKAAYLHYKNLYPEGSFKTMSYYDDHYDHALMGDVLRDMPGTWDRRYYIKTHQQNSISGHYTARKNLKEALLDYAPIGWLSGPPTFVAQFTAPGGSRNKYHT